MLQSLRLLLLLAMALMVPSAASRAEPAQHPMPFACNSALCFTTSEVRMFAPNTCADVTPTGIWAQTPPPLQCTLPPPQTWTTVDLTSLGVPINAPAAFLSGMLIITAGYTNGTVSIYVGLRRAGSSEDPGCVKYLGQTLTVRSGDGARSNWSTWVPLTGGKFEWCYQIQKPDNTVPDYGLNMSLQAYAQPAAGASPLLASPMPLLSSPAPASSDTGIAMPVGRPARTPAKPERKKPAVQGWCKSVFGSLCP